jgi:succinyl-CoA synthetase alpha subunit
MSVLVNRNTRVLTQGITGSTGQLHTRLCREYGTQMVGGVTPGRGGTDFEGIPIFDTVAHAVRETGATASVVYVPPAGAADAVMEAADAGLPLVVCITEGVPVLDMVRVKRFLEGRPTRLIGPNCPGTVAVIMIGEIGGTAEEDAAAFIQQHMTKPVVAFIAGQTAPKGKRMGHAGAIISGGKGTAAEKMEAFRRAGVTLAPSPAELGATMQRVLQEKRLTA